MVVNRMSRIITVLALLALALGISGSAFAQAGYSVTKLVSNVAGQAANQDPQLVNAWGISFAPGGPFWVSDNGTGVSTLYNAQGVKQSLVVTIPSSSGTGTGQPTGQVYNASANWVVTQNGKSGASVFIFDTSDGTISGWNGSVNPSEAVIAVNNTGAEYTGLAVGSNNGASFLYAADNLNNRIDVYDTSFNKVNSFTDTSLPAGSAPYNVVNIGGQLYVPFTNGSGTGVVDIFTTAGTKVKTFTSGGTLRSPWGVALAPKNFGPASGAILVGNEGDGRVNAFNATSGKLIGESAAITSGLWALNFGGAGSDGQPNQLFFTSGPAGYSDGLFGVINFK